MQYLDIKEKEKILIVAPHPDDECIGAGGVLALYPKQCTVLVLTDGRQGQGDVAPEKEKVIRREEFLKEMQSVGAASWQMLDYEDGTLLQHTDCLADFDLSQYTKIFVTGMHDGHADHTAACICVFHGLKQQKAAGTEVYAYEVHVPLRDVTHMLDITSVLEKKLELIRFHQSQLQSIEYDRLAESLARYRGIQNEMKGCWLETYCLMPLSGGLKDAATEIQSQLQKFKLFYWVLTRWMKLKQLGVCMASILCGKGFQRIAVYGYAELGQLLCQELRQEQYQVSYVMDKKVCESGLEELPVYYPDKNLPEVDAVVVTAVYYFDEIHEELRKLGFKNVLSLRSLVEGDYGEFN